MRKNILLKELDCANCAAKIENAVSKITGVNSVKVNFMGQKMILDAQDNLFDSVLTDVIKITKKIDSDIDVIVK